jgi:hypothetical protein
MKTNLKVATSLLFLFIAFGLTSPDKQNDRQKNSLKGPVKLVYKLSSNLFTFEQIDCYNGYMTPPRSQCIM